MGKFFKVILILQLVTLCFCSQQAMAVENFSGHKNSPFVLNQTAFIMQDDHFGLADITNIHYRSVSDAISLRVVDAGAITAQFSYKVNIRVDYYSQTSTTPTSNYATLTVRYNLTQGNTYKGVDTYNFQDAYKVVVTVLSVGPENAGENMPADGQVQLTGNISIDRTFPFAPDTEIPIIAATAQSNHTIDTANKQLLLSWAPVSGAEEYDVEWTTLDKGDPLAAIAGQMLTNDGSVPNLEQLAGTVFLNNASRITTPGQQDTISLSFNDDYLLVRIRQVQYSDDGVRNLGKWCYKFKSDNPATGYVVLDIGKNWHAPNLNWQYAISYAEDGKKKEVISYFDGTLRNRQTVTLSNFSTTKVPVVQESVYDNFGRPVGSILPAPILDAAGIPFLHYFGNLNRNTGMKPYSYTDIIGTGTSTCEVAPGTVSVLRGTARYYSLHNDFRADIKNKYVPDAEGYPIAVTQYMADNTGRVSLQGGVGKAFQPGLTSPSHVTRYIYGKPDQWELDQMFGNDVGYAQHYSKNIVIDPNYQMSVSYLNASGKTIATALAGAAPAGMDTLTSHIAPKFHKSRILQPEDFTFNSAGLKFTASTTYAVTVTGPDTLAFNAEQLIYSFTQNGITLCSSCLYDLNVTVANACNPTSAIKQTFVVGKTANDCAASAAAADSLKMNFSTLGEYYITAELVLSKTAMENYLTHFITSGQQNGMVFKEWHFIRPYLDMIDFSGVLADCSTAASVLGTQAQFSAMFDDELRKINVNIDSLSSADSTGYSNWKTAKYTALYTKATSGCDLSPCNDIQAEMLKDVSPGGQYALFDGSQQPLEATTNVISNNWRTAFPVKSSTDPIYIANAFTRADGTVLSANDPSATLTDIVTYWNNDWAMAFLQYHPEDCKLIFCQQNSYNESWDEHVKQLTISRDSDVRLIPGAPVGALYDYNNPDWLLNIDPFFKADSAGAAYKVSMQNDLDNYSRNVLGMSTLSNKNLSLFIGYSLYCSANCGTSDTPTSNCWDNCSPSGCHVAGRDWELYKNYYFELKKKYFDLARASAACSAACPVGQVFAPTSTTCASVNDFTITATSGADLPLAGVCSDTQQSVTLAYDRGVVGGTTYVYLYVSPEYAASVPAGFTFAINTGKQFFCIPKGVPLSALKIKAVNCTGVAPPVYTPSWGDLLQYPVGTSTLPTGTIQNANFNVYICNIPKNNPTAVIITYEINPAFGSIVPCSINDYIGYVVLTPYSGPDVCYILHIDPIKRYGKVYLSCPNGCHDLAFYGAACGTGYTYTSSGNPTTNSADCTVSSTLPPSTCSEAYLYKTSRFDVVAQPGTYPANDYPTTVPDFTDQNNLLTTQQVKTSCEGNAERWMAELAPGIQHRFPTFSAAALAALKTALTNFCEHNGDINHPMGASTLNPDPTFVNRDAPYTSFAGIIKAAFGNTLYDDINPWLFDGPNPYNVPVQYSNLNISNSTAAIAAQLGSLQSAYVAAGSPGTFYNYLATKFGSAALAQFSADDLAVLQAASPSCNYLLARDILLPAFIEPGKKGFVTYEEFSAALTDLTTQIASVTSSTNYPVILPNFMNQRFGMALGYSQWKAFGDAAVAGSILSNLPPFVPVVTDAYAPIKNQITIAVANGKRDYQAYMADQKSMFRSNYIATCTSAKVSADNIARAQNYHYTLYYYDQADNLIRTIPPEGVNLLTDAQIKEVQQIRGQADVSDCGITYTGPAADTNPVTAFNNLTLKLSSGQNAALEFWLYNTTNNGNQFSKVTPNGLYLFQLNINGETVGIDVYSSPQNGTFTHSNRITVGLSGLPPLQAWTHIVVQSNNFLTGEMTVYVNGLKAPVINNAPPDIFPENLTKVKDIRFYNRVLYPEEIMNNATNHCFMPLNLDGYWARFNTPLAGSETTISASSTVETDLAGIYPNHLLPTSYVYNSTNQVVQQYSPDGNNNRYWYDMLSRLVVSQNDKQQVGKNFSYTTYDVLGRITEVGQKNAPSPGFGDPDYLTDDVISNFNSNTANKFITHTYYDAIPTGVGGLQTLAQNNLRKRVAISTYRDAQANDVQQATYYSYDIDGNVNTLWQQINGLGTKRVDYEYDLVSGKVNFVRYQHGQKDEFYYKYLYDAENRLLQAWSGTMATGTPFSGSDLLPENGRLDASYSYYLHGPLARVELGDTHGKVQGLDYVYTLQGWLKGVNGQDASTAGTTDVGQDGMAGNHSTIARDAYAFSIGYYNSSAGGFVDYKPVISTMAAFAMQFTPATGDLTGQNLYNGNISNSTMAINQTLLGAGAPVGYSYHYDQLNRLKNYLQHAGISGNWGLSTKTDNYKENVSYDGNGNILTYRRYGVAPAATPAVTPIIDELKYNYSLDINGRLNNNRLNTIKDTITTSYGYDLANQTSATNYTYDQTGNLTKDAQNGLTSVVWNVYNKITNITDATGTIAYTYDAAGNRVSKLLTLTGTPTPVTTWYVRDAQGNTLAVYDNAGGTTNWREQDLYGSSRLGMWTPNLNVGTGSTALPNTEYGFIGRKYYELNNHLGNVMATISDRRVWAAGVLQPDIITAQDYYPFGMLQPGRQYVSSTSSNYRYGFNGKENDNDVKGVGNQQDYGMRIYDPRVGRFLSVDPIAESYPWYTPYQFSGNSPISQVDIDGEEPLYFMIRRFEHSAIFGFPFIAKGDARTTSINVRSTARVHHLIGVEIGTVNGKTPIIYNNAISSSSKQYTPWPGKGKESPLFQASGEIHSDDYGISSIYFRFGSSAAEPIAKKLFGRTMPAIDTRGFIGISSNKNNSEVKIHGTVSGDDFPDGEAFIYDSGGNGFDIGEYKHSIFGSPVKDLIGEGAAVIMTFDVTIKLDENGNFKSGSIMKDGKTTNLKLYNKKQTNFDPKKLPENKNSTKNESL